MNALPQTELAAYVVAWHNRHPLARRIEAAHVHSMGYVVLPFVAPGAGAAAGTARATPAAQSGPAPGDAGQNTGATLRERATARAQASAAPAAAAGTTATAAAPPAGPLEAAFSEDFMAPLPGPKVARWIARHGAALPTPAGDFPLRQIKADSGIDTARLTALWVLTAQIEVGQRSVRLLLSHGATPQVLGRRLWSLPRLAGVVTLAAALGAGVAAALTGPTGRPAGPAIALSVQAQPADRTPATASMAAPAAAAVAATAPPSAATSAVTAAATSAVTSAVMAVPAPAAAAASAAPAVNMPLDVEATAGRIALPSLGPRIDQRRLAAQGVRDQAASQAAGNPAATASAQAVAASPALAPATTARSGAAPVTAGAASVFAVSTRLLRTRTESQQVAAAMRALLVTPDSPRIQVEVLPAGDDFRVVGWPYGQRAEAEKARARLVGRGLKVEVVDF